MTREAGNDKLGGLRQTPCERRQTYTPPCALSRRDRQSYRLEVTDYNELNAGFASPAGAIFL
jgi:hypothetical protein